MRRFGDLALRQQITIYSCLLVYLVSLFLWTVAPAAYRAGREWSPYEVVLTTLGASDAEARLRQAGAEEVITRKNTEVLVTRFNRVEAVSLETALKLDDLDPRKDPYISGLESFFDTGKTGLSMVLVKAGGTRFSVSRLVSRSLGGGSSVAGFSPVSKIVPAAVFVCAIGLSILVSRRLLVFCLAAAAAWIPSVTAHGFPAAVAASVVVLTWSACAEDITAAASDLLARRSMASGRLPSAVWPFFAAACSVLTVLFVSGPEATLTVLVALVGLSMVTVAVAIFGTHPRAATDHDLFLPISLFTGAVGVSPGLVAAWRRPAVLLVFATVLLFAPPLVDRVAHPGDVLVPRQGPTVSGQISYESVSVLHDAVSDDLVDISDYLAHRAYQQTLAYGREYRLPEYGETVTLTRFRETESGSYVGYSEDVVVFDEAWLAESLSSPPYGISSLLVSLGQTAGVVASLERGLYSGYSQILTHMIYVVLALGPAAVFGSRAPRAYRRRSKVAEIARRRKQVA
jgi:hypothetical protein